LNTQAVRGATNLASPSSTLRDGNTPKTAFVVKEVPAPSNVPLVNSLRCRLDFSLDARAEGSPVEVWATSDGSKTWVKCGEIPQGRSPAVVALPQDGLYGFLFTAQTPGGTLSPRPGTMPDAWVEVDTTKPTLELQSVKMGSGSEAGDLLIAWHAHDRNFGTEPVHIYYTTQTAGQWFAIAQGVPNSGKYRWSVPSGLTRVFIRIEVTDRAGNMTRVETPEAIQVECARIPVKVLSIAPVPGSEK
jgi:hypothetical protein